MDLTAAMLEACLVLFFFLKKISTVTLSFVFDQYCPIIDYLCSKVSSHELQINCAISYFFYLYFVLHACAIRFDVTKNLKNFANFFEN